MFSCEFCEISKNSFSYIAPPVAASGLKLIFHWNAYSYVFAKSLFVSKGLIFTSRTAEEMEVSSVKSLQFNEKPST